MLNLFSTKPSIVASVALLATPTIAQTPPGFAPSSDTHLVASYGSIDISPAGVRVALNATKGGPPSIQLPSSSSSTLILMIDLDTPFGSINRTYAPYLHWLQPSIPSNVTSLSAAYLAVNPGLVPYVAPNPPARSPEHRFALLAFEQEEEEFVMPKDFESYLGSGLLDRIRFNVTRFVAEAGLGGLKAADWFTVVPENATTTNNMMARTPSTTAAQFESSAVRGALGIGTLVGAVIFWVFLLL